MGVCESVCFGYMMQRQRIVRLEIIDRNRYIVRFRSVNIRGIIEVSELINFLNGMHVPVAYPVGVGVLRGLSPPPQSVYYF